MPFCAAKCDYCAFATWTDRHHLQQAYLDACLRDIERTVAAGLPAATSIFVGGGTPSLVEPTRLVAALDAVPRAPGCEVTIECNPDTVTAELVAAYAAGGVNRLSLGVQSLVDHVLVGLGRTHVPANVRRAVALARDAGIPTFNLDLIYGGAGSRSTTGGARSRVRWSSTRRTSAPTPSPSRRGPRSPRTPIANPTTTTRPRST